MAKRLLLYIGIAIAIFLAAYYQHSYVLWIQEINTPFSLLNVYLFQAIASLLLIVFFEGLASLTTRFKDQLGFLYLGSIVVKMLFFCIIFRRVLFSTVVLTKADSLSLLIPIFIFLFYEVYFMIKILNRTT